MTGYNQMIILRHLRSVKRKYEEIKARAPNAPLIDEALDNVLKMIELTTAVKTRG